MDAFSEFSKNLMLNPVTADTSEFFEKINSIKTKLSFNKYF